MSNAAEEALEETDINWEVVKDVYIIHGRNKALKKLMMDYDIPLDDAYLLIDRIKEEVEDDEDQALMLAAE